MEETSTVGRQINQEKSKLLRIEEKSKKIHKFQIEINTRITIEVQLQSTF